MMFTQSNTFLLIVHHYIMSSLNSPFPIFSSFMTHINQCIPSTMNGSMYNIENDICDIRIKQLVWNMQNLGELNMWSAIRHVISDMQLPFHGNITTANGLLDSNSNASTSCLLNNLVHKWSYVTLAKMDWEAARGTSSWFMLRKQ